MFNRSRRNLAYWFASSMGGILIVFAGASYYFGVEEQMQAFDQALYKKGKAIATGTPFQLYQNRWRMVPREYSIFSGGIPSLNGELVYVRLYNSRGELVQAVGVTNSRRLTVSPGFQTLKQSQRTNNRESVAQKQWLRQATLPVIHESRLIGYLQLAAPLTPLEESLNRIRLFLSLGVPITLGVIGVTGWFLGGIAMQPTRRSYEQLQRFTADASHELRAPLAAILSNAQVGLMSTDDRGQQQLRLEKIVDVAKSMSTLISNLLFLSRHEGALNPADLKTINLIELLQSIVEDQTIQTAAANLTFTVHLPEQPVTLRADADLLKQAITNLLSNAFKYTPNGGMVQLRLLSQSHRAMIQVEDDGIGIPEADLPHVFERFYRVDTARSRQTGGFGLGLAIAQQIVEAHQGKITVMSTVDQGSMFQIELPLK